MAFMKKCTDLRKVEPISFWDQKLRKRLHFEEVTISEIRKMNNVVKRIYLKSAFKFEEKRYIVD